MRKALVTCRQVARSQEAYSPKYILGDVYHPTPARPCSSVGSLAALDEGMAALLAGESPAEKEASRAAGPLPDEEPQVETSVGPGEFNIL